MTPLTPAQLAALRRIRTASGIWRHWVPGYGLDFPSWLWPALTAKGLLERRTRQGRYDYRLTDAGHEAVEEANYATANGS